MLTRIISALIGAPIIILFLIVKGNYLFLFAGILSLIGMYEYYKAIKASGTNTLDYIGYAGCIALYAFQFFYPYTEVFGMLIAAMVLISFTFELFNRKHGVHGIVHTIFGFVYVAFLFIHMIYINQLQNSSIILWLPFITAWFTDTAAYFTGVTIGKHKLFPTISPKKTVEGYIGGILGSSILTTIFGLIITRGNNSVSMIHFIIIGLICGLFSEIGDLSASYIKRQTNIKDFGKLIPGHGGILDRFDSILFTMPVVYYYFLLVQNI